MIPRTHPYWHVRALVERRADVVAVPVSYYTYSPQTVADTRTTWAIPKTEFVKADYVESVMDATPEGQEMAIHSDLQIGSGERVHMVMVDMSTAAKAHLAKLRTFLGDNFFQQISWYSSGRSFHGYGKALLFEAEWVKFMGLLLLANQPRLEPTVDPRWIGHRLFAGYASLRWTRNTSHYLSTPTSLDQGSRQTGHSSEIGARGRALNTKS
jgi:hypothetical protein